MEKTKNKCIVCDNVYPQKGLSFFKFPKDQLRFMLWMKEISPAITSMTEASVKYLQKHGRVCANHFKDTDFKNNRKKTLIEDACPNMGIKELTTTLVIEKSTNESETLRIVQNPVVITTSNSPSEDIFECGRCKAQFNLLTQFMTHKQAMCGPQPQDINTGTEGMTLASNILLTCKDDKVPVTNYMLHGGQLVEVVDETSQGLVSFVINDSGGVITRQAPVDLSYLQPYVSLSENDVDTSSITTNIQICEIRNDILNHSQDYDNSEQKVSESENMELEKGKPCSYCGKMFDKMFNLHQHERIHTGERPFQCIICGRAFAQKSNVRKHMIRHKVWPEMQQTLKITASEEQMIDQETLEGVRKTYNCQYCSKTFENYFLYKKHLVIHSEYKVFRCIQRDCKMTFRDLDDFLSHSDSHQEAEFQCHVCHKMFSSLGALGAHQYDHDVTARKKNTFDRKLKCNFCNAVFKNVESLRNHSAVESHNYECPQCKTVFTTERFLRRHLSTHVDLFRAKYRCEVCHKTFRNEKYLQNHSYTHSTDKPLVCEHCPKTFTSNFTLLRHVAYHLKRRFECPFKVCLGCEKKFYRKDKLHDHILTHTNLKVRPCDVCCRTYTSLTKLQRHMKREHGVQKSCSQGVDLLKCNQCSQRFKTKEHFMRHCCSVVRRKGSGEDEEEGRRPNGGSSGSEEENRAEEVRCGSCETDGMKDFQKTRENITE